MTSAVFIQIKFLPPVEPTDWEAKSHQCARDLTIKKIALGVLIVLNAILLGAVAYSIATASLAILLVPAQLVLLAPFLAGIISTFTFLELPTGSVTQGQVRQITDTPMMVGKALSFFAFYPIVYAMNKTDWTRYDDVHESNRISFDLENLSLDDFSTKYAGKVDFSNLGRYGFVTEEQQVEMKEIVERYVSLRDLKNKFEDKHAPAIALRCKNDLYDDPRFQFLSSYDKLGAELENRMKDWSDLQSRLSVHLPHPSIEY